MPSRADAAGTTPWWRAALAACVLGASAALAVASSAHAATANAATPLPHLDAARVEAAASAVRADPDLGGVRKESTWRLRDRAEPDSPTPPLLWLGALARWLAESGRVLVWLLAAVVLAVVLVTARRWLAVHGDSIGTRGARAEAACRQHRAPRGCRGGSVSARRQGETPARCPTPPARRAGSGTSRSRRRRRRARRSRRR